MSPPASLQRAQALVEQALAAHGEHSLVEESGEFEVRLEGMFDLSTRLQGRSPDRDEPTPIVERIVFDASKGTVSYTADIYNYYSSNQIFREIYDDQRRMIYLDLLNSNGGWVPVETVPDIRERFTRVLPGVVLREALDQARTLRHLDAQDSAQPFDIVSYTSMGGDLLSLAIDRKTALLQSLTSVIDMPLLGMVEMSWHWSGYSRHESGAMLPGRLDVLLGERVLKTVSLSIDFGTFPDAFDIPAGIDIGDPPDDIVALDDFVPHGQRPPEVETLAPQVYMVKHLRPGFGLLFVEFDRFVVAVDAPTGWFEMNQIPPRNWSHGDSVSALGEKYLAAIRQTVPDKPVRHLVLTHHHSDHIGGLLPFVDAGANLLAGASAARMAKIASARRSKDRHQCEARPKSPVIEIVDGKRVISDGDMEMQLIELPDGNPKADDYVMVYLPKQKLLYATAFIYPVPEAVFPPKESIPLSVYFVKWLDESGLDIETIYNVHAMNEVESWQLDAIRRMAKNE